MVIGAASLSDDCQSVHRNILLIRGNRRKGEPERKMRHINKNIYNMVEATPYIHIQLAV